MPEAHELVEKFLKPWLAANHPHASIVFMAGSYGRAMAQTTYQPIASSDVDLIIIYTDLEKGGWRAATQVFTMEDIGPVFGTPERILMVDTNIHDFASLHYHDKFVRENMHFPFVYRMIEEGYILLDKTGVAPILKDRAKKFLEDGPAPDSRAGWNAETARLEIYLKDIAAADSVEEKRFLGVIALNLVSEYVLGLNQSWRSGSNQAYRSLARHFPEDEAKITAAFSALIRTGDSTAAESLMAFYVAEGRALAPHLPDNGCVPLYMSEQYVSPQEITGIRDTFLKFMTEHVTEALETSQRRGELAYLENLSAAVSYTRMGLERQSGIIAGDGRAAMHYFSLHMPDMLPAVLQALDDNIHAPVLKLADAALSHMGGLNYKRLENYYEDDVARYHAVHANDDKAAPKKTFKPGFTL